MMNRYEYAGRWVQEAKELLNSMQLEPKDILEKSGYHDIVTKFDREIETYLRKKIHEFFPEDRIIGEEFYEGRQNGAAGGSALEETPVWYLDPIDGTTNFVNQRCNYAISVGCAVGGEMEFGIVLDVAENRCYQAFKGKGAWMNGKQLHTSRAREIKSMLLTCPCVTDVFWENYEKKQKMFALLQEVRAVRSLGSVALELCQVACGKADLCVAVKSSPWDHNAARLILKEAGGAVRTLSGEELPYDQDTSFLAGNSEDALLKVLSEYL